MSRYHNTATKVTVYCLVSACTPEASLALVLGDKYLEGNHGPLVTRALRKLSRDPGDTSQYDLSVIGHMDASGEQTLPSWGEDDAIDDTQSEPDILPETDLRVLPHCTTCEAWDDGCVEGPPPNDRRAYYLLDGDLVMVQTHSLDIMALATDGRMTPLRLWNLATTEEFDPDRPYLLKNVDYGEIEGKCDKEPNLFPGLKGGLGELDELGDVELVIDRLVHEGKYWIWMSPDGFPLEPTPYDPPPSSLFEAGVCEAHGALARVPMDVLIHMTSHLPLSSLINLASTSRFLRTNILGNDYLAYVWLCASAPWWIPAPTRTPHSMSYGTMHVLPYPASQPSPFPEEWDRYPSATGLDWAYVRRCVRSGSMRNRQRIWKTVLDIERLADQVGV